ncbi:MAG: hypothetical protein Q8M03_02600 [Legionella sp.]|nr:hypothetical protein [Legionella sp.]
MGNRFADALSSKMSLTDLQLLFRDENPDANELNALITKLDAQEVYDVLYTLLTLLKEDGRETLPLQMRIYILLLTDALKHANKPEAIRLLRELGLLLPEEKACWTEVISALVICINSANDAIDCSYLLQNLAENPRELLFERLFEMVEGKPLWLDSAIEFVVHSQQMGQHRTPHFQKLASTILLSLASLSDTQIKKLSLILTNDELIAATFQLRATAATYYSENKENEPRRITEKRHRYLTHYETLLTALTVRATLSPSGYQKMVEGNSELANLLMTKRLNTLPELKNQQALISEILTRPQQFNWEDSQFNNLVIERLLETFSTLPMKELSLAFKDYFQYHSKKNIRGVIHFLDLLFLKTNNDTLLQCINANDDNDHTLTINFITQSNNRTAQLTEYLLQRLDIVLLINLCGHIVALKQVLQQETDPLLIIYCQVLCKKIREHPEENTHALAWANAITQLPEDIQDELVTAAFANFDKQPFQFMWLKALLTMLGNKSKLFSHCKATLKNLSILNQEKLLSYFSKEELLDFYLFMSRSHAQEQDFNCFVTLFAQHEKQPELIYFLLNTPITEQLLLNRLLPLLQDKNLITLIKQLIIKALEDSSYSIKLELTLLHFCARLQLSLDEKNAIHHWVKCKKSQAIAHHLLESPDCFHSLCSRSSAFQNIVPSILQGIVSHDVSTDLKLRAARVFNQVTIDEAKAEDIALRLLSHFHHNYKELQTIFINLIQAELSFDAQGKSNVNLFLRACFKLLKPDAHEEFNQEASITVLTTQLGAAHRFDSLLARLAKNEDAGQSAHYLLQIEAQALAEISEQRLAAILLKSVQETTAENWQKVSSYLNSTGVEKTTSLVKTLIAQCQNCPDNPLLTDKARLFIIKLAHFKAILPLLDNTQLQWLVKECPPAMLRIHFPEWLDILLANPSRNMLDLVALLALIPSDSAFLKSLYQHPQLIPELHSLFIQFSCRDQCTNHLLALFQPISRQSEEEKRLFMTRAQQEIEPKYMTMVAAPILNMLLLSLSDLKAARLADRKLIDNQLHFFTRLAVNPSIDATQLPQFTRSLQQLVLNIFALLSSNDEAWTETLLNSKYFAQSALVWLKNIDEKSIPQHPFTQILMDNAHQKIHLDLVNNDVYQGFIQSLLTHPPMLMTNDQFRMLFMTLNPANQKSLALRLLQRPTLDDVQWSSLIVLSQVLEPTELYEIYEQSNTPFVVVDLLFRHPLGVQQLQNGAKNTLLDSINSAKQVLRILDSQSPVAIKFAFVDAIFNYLDQTETPLLTWLLHLHVDAQTLAALANFTATPKHQQQLNDVITSDDYRKRDIQYYLQNPDLDMVINREGLLYQFLEHAWVNPWSGWHCHPQLLNALDKTTAKTGLKAQVKCLSQIHHLETFYEPLGICQETAREYLLAARWILRFPLLSDGLLEILHTYGTTQDKEKKAAIEQSKIYSLLLAPLLAENHLQCSIAILGQDFRELLTDYLDCTAEVNPAPPLPAVHQEYTQQIAVIEHFSPPRLFSLFNPSSWFARIKKNSVSTLQPEEISLLANAPEHHRQWLTERKHLPAQRFNELMAFLLKNPHLLQDLSLQRWLLASLFSPVTDRTSAPVLQQIIALLNPDTFARQIEQTHSNISAYEKPWDDLGRLLQISSLKDMVADLLTYSPEELSLFLKATNFASGTYLSALLELVLQAKRVDMNAEHLQALLPPQQFTNGFELDWIHNELKNLNTRALQLSSQSTRLAVIGYKYHHDEKDSHRLLALADSFLKKKHIEELAHCLNSYEVAFDRQDEVTTVVLQTLSRLLTESSVASKLAQHLHSSFIKRIIDAALQNPAENEFLLQQIIQAGCKEECRELLSAHLQQVLSTNGNSVRAIGELSPAQLSRLPLDEMKPLFIVQRLFFQIEPVEDLAEWQKNADNMPAKTRELFVAEASMLATLRLLEKRGSPASENEDSLLESKRRLAYWFKFLQKNTFISSYYAKCYSLTSEEPAVYYHWQCLLHFLSPDLVCLSTQFINWLRAADISQVSNQHFLTRLLELILDKNLLAELCELLQQPPLLEEAKSAWLFTSIMAHQPKSDFLINTIVTACPWSWLALQIESSENRLPLLMAALKEGSQYQAIFLTEQSLLDFMTLLTRFSTDELIDLLYSIPDKAPRSLIAFHLLTRNDYLQNINGSNFLADIENAALRVERRLKPLTHHIKLKGLPVSLLEQLSPEAAASLFCSVPHFHLLNEERVMPLMKRLGSARNSLIRYWLYYYAIMPNSHEPLIVLTEKFPTIVLSTLKTMSPEQCRPVLFNLIQHIHRINQLPASELLELVSLCNESHLIYAIQLYLHGWKNESLESLIIVLIKSFLANAPLLSSSTIQLLVRLNKEPAFNDVQDYIGKAAGDYLRSPALSDCSIFYDVNGINIKRMQELIPLSREQKPEASSSGFIHNLWQSFNLVRANSANAPEGEPLSPENPLIAVLEKRYKSIKTINYFLIHYKGDLKKLKTCMDDYLTCIEQSKQRTQQLRDTSRLMTMGEIDSKTREMLFNCFLNHSKLVHGKIIVHLLKFDAEKVLLHFGKNHSHERLLTLCDEALSLLGKEDKITTQVKTAKAEVEFESKISQISGFLASLRIRLKRCWFYGWNGWFSPKPPRFITIGQNISPRKRPSTDIVVEALKNKAFKVVKLEALLKEIDGNASLAEITPLYEALTLYEWEPHDEYECAIRTTVDALYEAFLRRSHSEPDLEVWLLQHQQLFINNRYLLIALHCRHEYSAELNLLLEKANNGPGGFYPVVNEIRETRKPERIKLNAAPPQAPADGGVVSGIINAVTSLWTSPEPIQGEASEPSKNWLQGWGFGLF